MRALWVVRSRPVESGTKGAGLEFYLTNGWKYSEVDGIPYARVAINRKKATTKENRELTLEAAIVDAIDRGESAASVLNNLELAEASVREAEFAKAKHKIREMFPEVTME